MEKELTQEEINALMAEIDIDDRKIDYDTRGLKTSISSKGRKYSEEHKKAISKALAGRTTDRKGTTLSEEWKQKLSAAKLGTKRGSMSEESNAKRRESISAYRYTTPMGIFETFKDMHACHPDLTRNEIIYRIKRERDGFSRQLKEGKKPPP